ncbi:MAG: helix-turn-helix domain-containing protein [Firmicutes bacterium]|nr:helix-turn-helix domain-containing protein [Bacillota bacterium]
MIQAKGKYIAALRANKGLSQRTLAKKIGVAHSTIHFIEHDKCEPTLKNLENIAQILEVDIIKLLIEGSYLQNYDFKRLVKLTGENCQ